MSDGESEGPLTMALWKEMFREPGPEWQARAPHMVDLLLEAHPRLKEMMLEEARLLQGRANLRRVLARRSFVLHTAEDRRIEGCRNQATLWRWLEQAVTAGSVGEALE